MTRHETRLCKAALDVLHAADGDLMTEGMLHAAMTEILGGTVSRADFDATMAILDARGWATVVPSEFKGRVRKSNPAGEAVLQEMR